MFRGMQRYSGWQIMATPKGLHILLFVMLCLRLCYSHRLLISSNEKAKDLHSHAEVGGVGSGSGMVGGSGDRSVALLYDWLCGSGSGCPLHPNHGVCGSCDCASSGPPRYNPFDPSCSGWVMGLGLGLSTIASITKPGLTSATPGIPKQADHHLS